MPQQSDKVTLGIVSVLGLNALGFDRIAVGCYLSGIIKMMMLIFSIVLLLILPPIGLILLIGWAIWAFIDYVVVLISLIGKRNSVPLFCDTDFNPQTQDDGRIFGYIMIFLLVVGSIIPFVMD